jgi:excisionase family DNA binding protein
MSQSSDEYLTLLEAAALLGMSPRTLRRWIRDERLAVDVTGTGELRLRKADVMRLVVRPDAEEPNGEGA